MGWNIDQWVIKFGHTKSKLGMRYEVVIRWRERIEDVALWGFCCKHHSVYAGIDTPAPQQWLYAVEYVEEYNTAIDQQLQGRLAECLMCVVLPFVPPERPHEDEDRPDVLYTILDLGAPSALWPRRSGAPDWATQELPKYLQPATPDKIPAQIRAIRSRQDAYGDPDHLGNHLTLLWEDPERLPPHARPFVAPHRDR